MNEKIKYVSENTFNEIPLERCIERCVREGVEIKIVNVAGHEMTIVKNPKFKEGEIKII